VGADEWDIFVPLASTIKERVKGLKSDKFKNPDSLVPLKTETVH
jgi:hypothetical protein